MPGRLAEQIAIVTGAAQGIGLAITNRFLSEGAKVIGIDKNEQALTKISELHAEFTAHVTDVEDHDSLLACVEKNKKKYGTVHVLVNNAGISYYEDAVSTSLEQWRHTHRVNIEAQFFLCKIVAPIMIKGGYGRIVNISSTQSIAVEPKVSAYAASKGGINALTRSLAVELAEHGIIVNAIAPGCIHTPMSIIDGIDETESDYFKEWYVKQRKIPLARPGEADEIASAALFLASKECSYVTGHILVVDGGLTITF